MCILPLKDVTDLIPLHSEGNNVLSSSLKREEYSILTKEVSQKWRNKIFVYSPGSSLLNIRKEFLSSASGKSKICLTESDWPKITVIGEEEGEGKEGEGGEGEGKEEEEGGEGGGEEEGEGGEDNKGGGNSTERNNRKSSCISDNVSSFSTILLIQAFEAKWTFSINIQPPIDIWKQKLYRDIESFKWS